MSSSRAGCTKGMSQSQLAHCQLPNITLRPLGEAACELLSSLQSSTMSLLTHFNNLN